MSQKGFFYITIIFIILKKGLDLGTINKKLMSALALDNEFMKYWPKLSVPEKKSLLSVAKNFVELKEETGHISIEQYNKEIDEAMARMDKNEFFTHQQAIKISKRMLNGK